MTEPTLRAVLAVIAVYHLLTGALALIAPGTFFNDIGRYGIENSHYVGDVGAFTFAFGAGLAIAVFRPSWRVPILGLGALWYGFHAINHAFDTGEARSDTARLGGHPSSRPRRRRCSLAGADLRPSRPGGPGPRRGRG